MITPRKREWPSAQCWRRIQFFKSRSGFVIACAGECFENTNDVASKAFAIEIADVERVGGRDAAYMEGVWTGQRFNPCRHRIRSRWATKNEHDAGAEPEGDELLYGNEVYVVEIQARSATCSQRWFRFMEVFDTRWKARDVAKEV